jgi:predicted alpha/beta superfamily hydrolase
MAKLIVFLLFCIATQADAQSTLDRITTGRIDTLYSKILDELRTVWVHVLNDLNSTKRYGVIYAFDGGGHFNALVSMSDLFSANRVIPPLTVVGVIHTDRSRELTPTHVRNMAPYNASDKTFSKTSGGGEALTR